VYNNSVQDSQLYHHIVGGNKRAIGEVVGGMNLAIMLHFVTIMTIMYKVKSQVSTFAPPKIKAKIKP
jgi:hypothetical protein